MKILAGKHPNRKSKYTGPEPTKAELSAAGRKLSRLGVAARRAIAVKRHPNAH